MITCTILIYFFVFLYSIVEVQLYNVFNCAPCQRHGEGTEFEM